MRGRGRRGFPGRRVASGWALLPVALAAAAPAVAGTPATAGAPAAAQEPGKDRGVVPRQEMGGRLEVSLVGRGEEPVSGALVRVHPRDSGEARRLAEPAPGVYAAAGLPPGPARLRVAAGRARLDTVLHLPDGELLRLTFRLEAGPLSAEEVVARIRGGGDPPAGHAVDRVRFGEGPLAPRSVAEWLRRLPGVDVRGRGPGGRQVVSLRGSRPEGVLVLLDGMPLNDPLTGVADLASVPVATLESATLVRGGTQAFGPGGLAGVLLLRSREPGGDAGRLRVEGGSFGHRAAEAAGSAAGSAGVLSTTVRYEESRNDFEFTNRTLPDRPRERRRNADGRAWQGAVSATAADLPLALRLRAETAERGAPGRMSTRIFDRARWRETAWQASLRIGRAAGPRARVGLRQRRQRYRDPAHGLREASRTGEVRFEGRVPLPGGRGSIAARLAREAAAGDGLEGKPERLSAGLTGGWVLRLGPVGVEPSASLDAADGHVAVSPAVALELPLEEGWRAWARAGRALRLPTFGDLYFASAYRVRPAPDLRPERVLLDAELGAAHRSPGGAWELRGVAFERRTDDPIVWLASAAAVWSPRNTGRLSARGLELDGVWRAGGAAAAGWEVQAAVTWERSRVGFGTNRNPLPHLPSWRGRLAVEGPLAGFRMRVEAEGVSSRTTTLAATHRLPGFALLHVEGSRELSPLGLPTSIDVRLRNVLDATYEMVPLFPEPGRSLEVGLGFGPLPP